MSGFGRLKSAIDQEWGLAIGLFFVADRVDEFQGPGPQAKLPLTL